MAAGLVQDPHRITINTPLGPITVQGNGSAVTAISFAPGAPEEGPGYLREAAEELLEYLEGRRTAFSFPVAPGGTPFQRRVWAALQQVPYGETLTYGQLAASLGIPGGARAVGSAAGRNPCPMAIPCHRLLAANGLGGFSGGLERKKALLSLEGIAWEKKSGK